MILSLTNLHFFSLIANSSSYIYHTPKQRKIKFKPESKLNDDIHTDKHSLKKSFVNVIFELIEFEFISIFPALITLNNSQKKKIHYIDLAEFFKTLLPSSFFYNFIKTESATTAFFLFASFFPPAMSIFLCFSFLGVVFRVYGMQETCLFGFLSVKRLQFRQVCFQKSR